MVDRVLEDRRPRVLQIGKYYWPFKGGIETIVRSLSQELQTRIDIRVLVANHRAGFEKAVIEGVPVSRANPWFTRGSAPVCPGMVAYIRAAGADLVHLHLPNPGAELAFLASGIGVPLIVSYHTDIVRQKLAGAMFGPVRQLLLRRAAAITVSSAELLESADSLKGHRDRCHIVPYGIATRGLERADPALVAGLREIYGPRIVLSVGRLVYYKGFELLIEAMREVDGHLVIVGEGPLRKNLQDAIHGFRVADRVTLAGGRGELAQFYHAAEVFALASTHRTEAFGIVQLEAMACGKPVVNTSIPTGFPRVSLDGVTGFTVPPGDVAALAKAINRLLDDPLLRARYGVAARQRVQSEFRVEEMVERVFRLYREIYDSARSTAASERSFAANRSTENR